MSLFEDHTPDGEHSVRIIKTPENEHFLGYNPRKLKGTGTRDLIWLKVISLDRSWLVGLTDDI